jgi:VWFA-related protein
MSSPASMAAAGQQNQTPVPFRAGVVLVPLDVRVIDAHGNPVTNLSAADFTILDDGVRQEIAHFATQSYSGGIRDTSGIPPDLDSPFARLVGADRIFAIVLGRGRLNEPAKGIDAIIDFVRLQLLPKDRVAVLAYQRATDLTTDHDSILRLLERFRARHETIEGKLAGDFRRFHGPILPISADTEMAIAALFDGPGLPGVRQLPGNAGARLFDLEYLLRAIDYLHHVQGEKHLIFLSENGLNIGTKGMTLGGMGDSVAKKAASARVTVSLIQTGGLPRGLMRDAKSMAGDRYRLPNPHDPETFRPADDRALAEETGGSASFYQDADRALDRLNRSTRFHYLLGYYPTKPPSSGEYREVRVAVDRPGVTVLYRHGYQARPALDEPDELRRVLTDNRIQAAGASSRSFPYIRMKLSASVLRATADEEQVRVDIAIDPSRVTFKPEEGHYTASLDVAVFVGDAREQVLGQKSERIDLKLDANAFARVKREHILHTVTVTVTGQPAHVKVVVYDYDADRVATATLRLP